jgi:hypothetical protein
MLNQQLEYSALIEDYMAMSAGELLDEVKIALRMSEPEAASMTKLELAKEMAKFELAMFFK